LVFPQHVDLQDLEIPSELRKSQVNINTLSELK